MIGEQIVGRRRDISEHVHLAGKRASIAGLGSIDLVHVLKRYDKQLACAPVVRGLPLITQTLMAQSGHHNQGYQQDAESSL